MTENQPKQAPTLQNQNIKEKGIQLKKRRGHWCCGIPAIIIMLVIVGITVSIFVIEKKQADNISKRDRPEAYSEIFNANFPSNYAVSAEDEDKFNQKIIILLQKHDSGTPNYSESGGAELFRPLTAEEAVESAKLTMKFLKDYYPEGYYLVVNQVLQTPEEHQMFPNLFLHSNDEESVIDFLVHELSHMGKFGSSEYSGSGYVIEDKFITLNKLALPPGDELLKYISEPASLDQDYLNEYRQDIYTTLDEVNSYTKSVRVSRAYSRYKSGGIDENAPQALSRQLYYLSLHLKNIKENHPDLWQALKQEQGFAYLLSRMISIAETEIKAAKEEGADSSLSTDFALSIDRNLFLLQENQALFDELYTATGIDGKDNLQNFTQQELSEFGLNIEKF